MLHGLGFTAEAAVPGRRPVVLAAARSCTRQDAAKTDAKRIRRTARLLAADAAALWRGGSRAPAAGISFDGRVVVARAAGASGVLHGAARLLTLRALKHQRAQRHRITDG